VTITRRDTKPADMFDLMALVTFSQPERLRRDFMRTSNFAWVNADQAHNVRGDDEEIASARRPDPKSQRTPKDFATLHQERTHADPRFSLRRRIRPDSGSSRGRRDRAFDEEVGMLDGLSQPVYGADDGSGAAGHRLHWWDQKFLGRRRERGRPAIGDRKP